MIVANEIELARYCIEFAIKSGASAARLSLNKNVMDAYTILNGELDKVSHSADRSIYLYLYVDGRYGTFSTNRLEKKEIEDFISQAVVMVRMLGEDQLRRLPDADRTAKDATTGLELDLCDATYESYSSEERLERAKSMSRFKAYAPTPEYTVLSEECEYAESSDDTLLIDSQGFEGRHRETSFNCFSEITIQDKEGTRYSGYWWEASPSRASLEIENCSAKALSRAAGQIGPQNRRSGRYKMVVDSTVASRLVSPILNALNASAIQQKMSFLEGSSGQKMFSEGLTICDLARTPGKAGSRMYDTEGVATADRTIIDNGTVREYFVSTYMAGKTGFVPTIEDVSRPCLMPFIRGCKLAESKKDVSLKDILAICGNGIYVTGFNGGNCNPVTGDFSFGIEGFAFSKGKITHPVKEMLITGNIMTLWNSLVAAGSDARTSSRWQIPTLAFENVSFSA
ncbi:MAG: TldD/PmbA family protein [Bacteroidales bacterium]|nr:TldD/PmbA family protein [Bacteroidales bacterium]